MKLRVATLNVWALPEPAGFRVNRRMRAIGSRLPELGLDVLALQEVWRTGAREALVEAGRRAGLSYAWHRSGDLRDGGLLVLSRLPILDARFERYALPGQPPRTEHLDYYAGKGFLQIRLAGEHGPFQVFDTHLHARYSKAVPHAYHAYRVGQIVQLALALRKTHEPVVVAGDFNLRDDTDEYRILSGLTGLRDVAFELGHREPTVYSGHPFRKIDREDKRVDYLFVRDGNGIAARPRSVTRVFDDVFEIRGQKASFSDHAGVLAEIELAAAPARASFSAEPEALQLASRTLERGRERATEQRAQDRLLAGAGLSGGLLAGGASVRSRRISRRRLLRTSLRGAALLALAPALGLSVLSEVFAPEELRAFDQLTARLEDWPGKGEWIA